MPSSIIGAVRYNRIFRGAAVATLLAGAYAGPAAAYVGESFLRLPGIPGGLPAGRYKGWVEFEAQYWDNAIATAQSLQLRRYAAHGLNVGGRVYYSGPQAPTSGAGKLNLSLDKRSPALKPLMDSCHSNAVLPELNYAESAELSRPPGEWGERPADIPQYFEYRLKGVQLSCPEVADAPEQALVLSFANIEWTNYKGSGEELKPSPANLRALSHGATETYVIKFIGSATDAREVREQCPTLNAGPTEADYYTLMSPEAAATEKAKLSAQGGAINTPEGYMFRGPGKLSACHLPGTVRDPGHVSPVSDVAHGFDLDGNDGTQARSGQRQHKNYVSEDGRKGIDNQLFSVDGCVPGLKQAGLLTASRNELMRNGTLSILLQISGIEDRQNDKSVDVTVLYSLDPMVKSASGQQILPRYTFQASDDPEIAPDFVRLHGRIQNGVVMTDPIKEMTIHDGGMLRITLYGARMRLMRQQDGTIKGTIGGYEDWRVLYNFWAPSRHFESGMDFTCPGMYNAFKRAADGRPDPVTGEFTAVSAAYDVEAIPAFLAADQQQALTAGVSMRKDR